MRDSWTFQGHLSRSTILHPCPLIRNRTIWRISQICWFGEPSPSTRAFLRDVSRSQHRFITKICDTSRHTGMAPAAKTGPSKTNIRYIILYYLILSSIILYSPILSYIILYYHILSYIILYYPILSYIILYYLILSYIIRYYLIFLYIYTDILKTRVITCKCHIQFITLTVCIDTFKSPIGLYTKAQFPWWPG